MAFSPEIHTASADFHSPILQYRLPACVNGWCIMNDQLYQALDSAWNQITRLLFCETINLIYDYVGSFDSHRFDFLPLPEEIRHGFPNNKGYSTGMEDSMINAGIAMNLCLLRAQRFPAQADECESFARRLLKGMDLCATVHGREGYIVRSVSHRDGKSCYPCSSRDQMTFWVWGLWQYCRSSFATASERRRIAELIVMLAERGEKEVVEENNYCILTLDGVPDVLNKMDFVQPHEALRLPMFYLVASALTGDRHWRNCYEQRLSNALTESARPKGFWNHFELSQFLLSLSICNHLDPRPEFVRIAGNIAAITEQQLCETFLPRLEHWNGNWCFPAKAWRDSTNISLKKQEDGRVVGADGRLDLRCRQANGFADLLDLVRIPGNLMMGLLLAPGYTVSPALQQRFLAAFQRPDYSRTCTCSSVCMLYSALHLLTEHDLPPGEV